MRSFQINDNRTFTAALFAGTLFDHMGTESIRLVTSSTLCVDGRCVAAFYTADELGAMPEGLPEFVRWGELRGLAFHAVKGKKAPVSFQIILHADSGTLARLAAREECGVEAALIEALVLTIRYESGVCRLTSGTALRTFIPDKSLDRLWDEELQQFLAGHGIDFSDL